MSQSAENKKTTQKEGQPTQRRNKRKPRDSALGGPYADMMALQDTAGNQAVNQLLQSEQGQVPSNAVENQPETNQPAELLQRASLGTGAPLEESVRGPMERSLGVNLQQVRVHSGPAAEAAAESIDARAYTVGSDIFLGPAARQLSGQGKQALLGHEAVHTVQQGSRPVSLQGRMPVSQPSDPAEVEASQIASTVMSGSIAPSPSPALGIRNAMRTTSAVPSIQRDIVGNKTFNTGKFEINFKKKEGKVPGDMAVEDGTIKFTPSKTAPESNSIRFVQIVRTTDKSSGTEKEFVWTGGEAARNKIMTKRNVAKNIAGGFFVDQIHALQSKRTKKKDPEVLPYYDVTSPGTIGKRKGKTIVPATLRDTPGDATTPGRFLFVSSAKASDTGTWYGTVLWGFEIFLDKKGVAKIKGEYQSFREWHGETTDAALKAFDEFYQNPGASTAPTK